ncbi:similar to Saccharomyces cerevisiae YKR086W PRP16 DEAH-box RNA helicase involved in second catalytic step of splicing [Maudiozyma saulgeensis]|uniref:Pre-mRNA-splicing factor ATP-dependent RNA helicase PRP16 n=1 Tax=Maudiozyma saulgeensis TaxID=1789683 RepID=A0A1X7R9L3_9SACH|nr:similar to Saccharomyces cerevisiae YKR086W PRP16 DEAH-box RNA helicase involved in second catalytic step of splicing [Kazachstania saulgeensis]
MNDQEIIDLLQRHTKANVSENFLKVVRKLKEQYGKDKPGFIKACNVLGKFANASEVLGKVFDVIEVPTSDGQHPQKADILPSKSIALPAQGKKRKFMISIANDDDEADDDDDDGLHIPSRNSNPFIKRKPLEKSDPSHQVIFKKIKKVDANRLKMYSKDKRIADNVGGNKKQITPAKEQNDTVAPVSFGTTTEIAKDWYNFDDDYGNPVSEEIEEQNELNSKLSAVHNTSSRKFHIESSIYQDALHSEIQLNILPTEQRKKWLPSFLIDYAEKYGITKEEIIGSIVQSTTNNDTINPFRNPESEFSVKARKGSSLVNLKRTQREQTQRAKDKTTVEGTKIGEALGLKDTEIKTDVVTNNRNLLKNGSSNVSYKEDIKATRQSLPCFRSRTDLLTMIRENQVSIIVGETGSGKTTQLPQYLYEDGFTANGKMVGVTQPRRVAAMSVAKRVAQEMNVKIKEEVGYSIRFEDYSSPKTRIKFMTDGILLREVLLDNDLDKYSCIIIDEAHERTLNTDVMLGILRVLLQRRKDLKLIITSATMNAAKFSKFFGNAPQFTIPGRTFPVEINYSKYPVSDYVEEAVKKAVNIHLTTSIESGDILIFMTGQEDVEATTESIQEKLLEVYRKKGEASTFDEINNIEIFPIYSSLAPELQSRIFHKLDKSKRKIVVATNIAETSLTIDGIRFVIDCGYSKLKVYNPRIGLDSLAITPISLANANQRSGRAGRTSSGVAYRLYTEETSETDMYGSTIPEIQRTNLSNTVLLLKSLGVENVMKFPFIDTPPMQTLLNSLYELWSIGALDNFGNLTKLGIDMTKLPLQPSLSKILLNSIKLGCSSEILIIVAMLSIPQIFKRPKEREKESDKARSRFFVAQSDHLTLLNVYLQWKSNHFSSQWCAKHFIQGKSLEKAEDIRKQLLRVMEKQKFSLTSAGSNWNIIRECICTGFSHQAAKLSGLKRYVHLRTGMHTQLHPTSALFGMGDLPSYIIYNELLMTSTEYLVCVTAVDPFWLMESGLLLYDIKKKDEINDYSIGLLGTNSKLNNNEVEMEDARKVVREKLDSCILRRKMIVDKLERDTLTSRQKKVQQTSKITNESQIKKPRAGFSAFKKRRPF